MQSTSYFLEAHFRRAGSDETSNLLMTCGFTGIGTGRAFETLLEKRDFLRRGQGGR
jgi:hypothetical protein